MRLYTPIRFSTRQVTKEEVAPFPNVRKERAVAASSPHVRNAQHQPCPLAPHARGSSNPTSELYPLSEAAPRARGLLRPMRRPNPYRSGGSSRAGGWIPTRSATPSTALVPQRKVGFPIPNTGLLLGFQGTKTARREGISSPFSDARGCTSPQNSGAPCGPKLSSTPPAGWRATARGRRPGARSGPRAPSGASRLSRSARRRSTTRAEATRDGGLRGARSGPVASANLSRRATRSRSFFDFNNGRQMAGFARCSRCNHVLMSLHVEAVTAIGTLPAGSEILVVACPNCRAALGASTGAAPTGARSRFQSLAKTRPRRRQSVVQSVRRLLEDEGR